MEDWLVSDFDWDPRALNTGELTFCVQQPGLSCSEGVLGSSQTASQLTAGSADGSGGSDQAPAPPPRAAPRSGASKGRRPRSGRTPASCQVEGCGISLEGGKPFYRLQRICEQHARAMFVTDASGRAMRFCQQCTRLHPLTEFEGSKRSCAVSLQRRMERKHRQKRAAERVEGGGGAAAGGSTRRTRGASSSRTVAATAHLAGSSSGDGSSPSGASPSTSGGGAAHLSQHSGGHSGLSAGHPAVAHTPVQPSEPQLLLGMPAHAPAYALPTLGGDAASAGTPASGGLSDRAAAAQYQQQDLLRQRQRQAQLVAEAEAHAALNGWGRGLPAPAPAAGLHLGAGAGAPLQPYGSLQGVVPTNTQPGSAWPGAAALQPRQAAVPSLTPDEIDQLLVMEPDDLAAALLAHANSAAAPAAGARLPSSALDALETALSVNCLPDFDDGMAQGMLGMVLTARPRSKPTFEQRGAAPTFDRPPPDFGLPPASQPAPSLLLAGWPAAHEAAALARSAGAPLPQALAAATADPTSLEAEPVVVRFSLKVYGLTPSQLPPHLKFELQSALATSPTVILGAVRSGCTQLTAEVLLSATEAAAVQHPGGSAGALAALLHAWQASQVWRLPAALPLLRVVAQAETASAGLLLQPLERAAGGNPSEGGEHSRLAAAGSVVCPLALGGAGAGTGSAQQLQRLQLAAAGPVATTVGAARGRFVLHCPDWQQLLLGEEPDAGRRVLHCRSRGRHVALALLRPGEPAPEEEGGAEEEAEEERAEEEDGEAGGDAGSSDDYEAAEAAEAEAELRLRRLLQQAPGAEVWVPAAEAQWGLFEFELASGPLLGAAAPVLVLPDGLEAAAAELQQLQQGAAQAAATQPTLPDAQRGHSVTTRVLRLVSSVLLFLEEEAAATNGAPAEAQQQHGAAYPPAARQRLAAAATWLCALCVRLRWPALLRTLLPATTACGGASEAVAAMDALLPAGLLGTAAAAGSAPLLAALADWAAAAGHGWQLRGAGSRALTPLHLAASLGPQLSAGAAAALVAAVGRAEAARSWAGARAGGWTPCQVATAAGTTALLDLLGAPPAPEAAAAAAEAALPSPAKGGASGAGSAAEEERLRRKQAALEAEEAEEAGLQKKPAGLGLGVDKGHGVHGAPELPRLPATAAEVRAWQQRAMHPAALLAVGGAAILLALGLAAALRSTVYA